MLLPGESDDRPGLEATEMTGLAEATEITSIPGTAIWASPEPFLDPSVLKLKAPSVPESSTTPAIEPEHPALGEVLSQH